MWNREREKSAVEFLRGKMLFLPRGPLEWIELPHGKLGDRGNLWWGNFWREEIEQNSICIGTGFG